MTCQGTCQVFYSMLQCLTATIGDGLQDPSPIFT